MMQTRVGTLWWPCYRAIVPKVQKVGACLLGVGLKKSEMEREQS